MAADPYHGVVMTFSGVNAATTFLLTTVGEFKEFRESVETTSHGTTGQRTFKPEVLKTTSPLEIEFHFSSDSALPVFGVAETITVSYPIPAESGNTTKAKVAGTGYLEDRTIGEAPSGSTDTVKGTAIFRWDGATDAVFTVQSA